MEQNNNPQNEIQQTESEKLHTSEVEIDREKIDRALDFFLQEQENAKEREKRSEQLQLKKEKSKKSCKDTLLPRDCSFCAAYHNSQPRDKKAIQNLCPQSNAAVGLYD